MTTDLLIAHGNAHRNALPPNPAQALAHYTLALVDDPMSSAAWNNYGNVMREAGYPDCAIPYLKRAVALNPQDSTAQFNLAVAYLLLGDYAQGWAAYESRWRYEHLAGLLPSWPNQWQGQDLNKKTILILGEQGLGDTIQFIRFIENLTNLGAKVIVQVPSIMVPLLEFSTAADVISFEDSIPAHDYWTPLMSIPRILDIRLENLKSPLSYLSVPTLNVKHWQQRLGKKLKLRVGIGWTGRKDTWINQHKAVPFDLVSDLIAGTPEYQWVNLQVDCSNEEAAKLEQLGVLTFPKSISNMLDSAALMSAMDVVIGVDTAVSHLAAALGKPTWIMLNHYAIDWRWLLNRNDSPWYPTARLFRQQNYHDWSVPLQQIKHHLAMVKI